MNNPTDQNAGNVANVTQQTGTNQSDNDNSLFESNAERRNENREQAGNRSGGGDYVTDDATDEDGQSSANEEAAQNCDYLFAESALPEYNDKLLLLTILVRFALKNSICLMFTLASSKRCLKNLEWFLQ